MPLEKWEQDLATIIDDYPEKHKGLINPNPLIHGLQSPNMTTGQYMVAKGKETGVDPALVLGICASESSLATNQSPYFNGGNYNIYGNSGHFPYFPKHFTKKTNYSQYKDYVKPTEDVFLLIRDKYFKNNLFSTEDIYKRYEGETTWKEDVPIINKIQTNLVGNPLDARYRFDDKRKAALAAEVAEIADAKRKAALATEEREKKHQAALAKHAAGIQK